jgi:hypothetical protein
MDSFALSRGLAFAGQAIERCEVREAHEVRPAVISLIPDDVRGRISVRLHEPAPGCPCKDRVTPTSLRVLFTRRRQRPPQPRLSHTFPLWRQRSSGISDHSSTVFRHEIQTRNCVVAGLVRKLLGRCVMTPAERLVNAGDPAAQLCARGVIRRESDSTSICRSAFGVARDRSI